MRTPPNFEDAPRGSVIFHEHLTKFSECPAIFFKIFRMPRTGAQFVMKKRRNLEDAPHGSAIFIKFSGCSAREHDFERKKDEDAPHGSAILNERTTKF